MKILMLCEFYNELLTYQENLLAKSYRKNGHDVTVVASTFESVFDFVNDRYDGTRLAKTYYDNSAKIIRLAYRYNIINRLRAFAGMAEILEKEKPDLIFVHDITPNILECIGYVMNNPRCRMILDYHADYSNSGKNWLSLKVLHGVIRKWFLDKARPYLHRIYPVTPASLKFLHQVYGIPYEEMEILPLGADLDMSRDVQAAGAGLVQREKYNIPIDSHVLFTGGKLTWAKQTEIVIEAFNQLKRADTWLIVVGDSAESDAPYVRRLREVAKSHPQILFVGWLNARQVLEHLDMSDIAVFPASQSILWQQAIGMGKPLVIGEPMARPGGDQDVSYLNLYGNIILTEDENPRIDGLAEILKQLIADPMRLEKMADGARRVASELLDWNVAVAQTLRFNVNH